MLGFLIATYITVGTLMWWHLLLSDTTLLPESKRPNRPKWIESDRLRVIIVIGFSPAMLASGVFTLPIFYVYTTWLEIARIYTPLKTNTPDETQQVNIINRLERNNK